VSGFSDVDRSPRPDELLRYLDQTDGFMVAFKAYVVAAAGRYVPGGRVLDLGCGVGHDLVRLREAGLTPVGLDASHLALTRARATGAALVRGDGARLPFLDDSFDACRIERVLQHVTSPSAVLEEVVRVVRPGGLVAVLEPDHSSMRVESDLVPDGSLPARCATVRHPAMGSLVADLLRERGCVVDDVVTELSFGYQLDGLPVAAERTTELAVRAGTLDAALREAWLSEQRARSEAGTFLASWPKVLVVARTAQ
jgi:ubiquinone/menaquinone biosynthesis C-methylase UbiE